MISKHGLIKKYLAVRKITEDLCGPLLIEDYVIQSDPDISPPKWHLAHSSWFFETFILSKVAHYKIYHSLFGSLFNSYYQSIGSPYPRNQRGYLARPSVETVYQYRKYVDEHMVKYMESMLDTNHDVMSLIELGIHHEQQHQELLLMDIKYNFSLDPSFPIYHVSKKNTVNENFPPALEFIVMPGGIVTLGNDGKSFCFDNEMPQNSYVIKPYKIANRLITNGEYLEFILMGGYKTPRWWLADGWDYVQLFGWKNPLYWYRFDNEWYEFKLSGLRKLNFLEPVAHISYYEADAYARWRAMRLPSEIEWENFVLITHTKQKKRNFLEQGYLHPCPADTTSEPQQLLGDLWEWTTSPYTPYSGYQPLTGAIGEYNGKFMSNQIVLRGGSCVTPEDHIRISYRNFFQPHKRWHFNGLRLASDT